MVNEDQSMQERRHAVAGNPLLAGWLLSIWIQLQDVSVRRWSRKSVGGVEQVSELFLQVRSCSSRRHIIAIPHRWVSGRWRRRIGVITIWNRRGWSDRLWLLLRFVWRRGRRVTGRLWHSRWWRRGVIGSHRWWFWCRRWTGRRGGRGRYRRWWHRRSSHQRRSGSCPVPWRRRIQIGQWLSNYRADVSDSSEF